MRACCFSCPEDYFSISVFPVLCINLSRHLAGSPLLSLTQSHRETGNKSPVGVKPLSLGVFDAGKTVEGQSGFNGLCVFVCEFRTAVCVPLCLDRDKIL